MRSLKDWWLPPGLGALPKVMSGVRDGHLRFAERIALLCGTSDDQAVEIGQESMVRFAGRPMSTDLADEITDWICREADERAVRR